MPASIAATEDRVQQAAGAEDEARQNLQAAFEEKRVIQVFQPVISLLNEETDEGDELHSVSLQYIDRDGTTKKWDEIRPGINTPDFRKFVDRWSLQEIIGRLTSNENNRYTFIIQISDASLADATLFNWLRKLLSGLDSRNPGKSIAVEIAAGDLGGLLKQAGALVNYLRKAHDFKFVLGEVSTAEEIVKYANSITFDYVRCNSDIISKLHTTNSNPDSTAATNKGTRTGTALAMIKSAGTRFIADDIEDATRLTEAISVGTDYACGDFIGEPVDRLDDVTNIESFEIA